MNENSRFFAETLQSRDPVIASEIALELRRQQTQIELIASENIVSAAVMEAQGTVLTNQYAEGYPSKRSPLTASKPFSKPNMPTCSLIRAHRRTAL